MWSEALGGLLLGAASIGLWRSSGRVAGVSGIVGGIAVQQKRHYVGNFLFLSGLVLGGSFAASLGIIEVSAIELDMTTAVFAGALVGVGTRFANGCTSGHGICGIGRFSPRSIAATSVFVLMGMVISTALRNGVLT